MKKLHDTASEMHKAILDLTNILTELTGNTFYVPEPLTLEDLPTPLEAFNITCRALQKSGVELPEHDCTAGPEDGCVVCSEYLPDRIGEEEDEEESGYFSPADEWDEEAETYTDDEYLIPDHIDGLNGEESYLAIEQLHNEVHYGEEAPIIL